MNLNQLTEKAIADQLGGLTLENVKLRAVIQAMTAENAALKAKIAADTEAKEPTNDHADAAAGAA